MMDPLWSKTCWSNFKYFITLTISTNYRFVHLLANKVFNCHWCTVQTWRLPSHLWGKTKLYPSAKLQSTTSHNTHCRVLQISQYPISKTSLQCNKSKQKLSLYMPWRHRGIGSTVPPILNLNIRCRWVGIFRFWPLYSQYPMNSLGEAHSLSGHWRREEALPMPRNELQFLSSAPKPT